MSVEQYLSKMKTFQDALLAFLRKENSLKSDFSNIIKLLDDLKIRKNREDFKLVLRMLLQLSNAFSSHSLIIQKIEQILINLKNDIKLFFQNNEIFIIFQKSKKILYFLIENKILSVNKLIAERMINDDWLNYKNYPEFFFPEIRPFINEEKIDEISREIPNNFEEKRKIGENDDLICKIIRNDSIQKFKDSHLNDLNKSVQQSIFETNLFLLKHKATLIEYAAFYGSFKIFNYLLQNKVYTNSLLILYAIHGGNQKIIQILQKNEDLLKEGIYEKVINESIKCHCNHLVKYFIESISLNKDKKINIVKNYSLKHYDFSIIQKSFIIKDSFIKLCKYDYFRLVDFLLKKLVIDLNQKEIKKKDSIQNHIFQ